jgi:hypothetical protein
VPGNGVDPDTAVRAFYFQSVHSPSSSFPVTTQNLTLQYAIDRVVETDAYIESATTMNNLNGVPDLVIE